MGENYSRIEGVQGDGSAEALTPEFSVQPTEMCKKSITDTTVSLISVKNRCMYFHQLHKNLVHIIRFHIL